MWECTCGAMNNNQFSICWKCEGKREETEVKKEDKKKKKKER